MDKIARRSGSSRTGAGSRDIGGEGVQQALLKLLEGREIFVPLNVTQHWNKHDFVQVDTSDILFICAGTFTDLHQAQVDKHVGFGAEKRRQGGSRLRVKELIEYGMLAELLGRLPVQVQLTELTADELYQVLTAPPDALTKEYREARQAGAAERIYTRLLQSAPSAEVCRGLFELYKADRSRGGERCLARTRMGRLVSLRRMVSNLWL